MRLSGMAGKGKTISAVQITSIGYGYPKIVQKPVAAVYQSILRGTIPLFERIIHLV